MAAEVGVPGHSVEAVHRILGQVLHPHCLGVPHPFLALPDLIGGLVVHAPKVAILNVVGCAAVVHVVVLVWQLVDII